MFIGRQNTNQRWIDILGHQSGAVVIDKWGYGLFTVDAMSASVWVDSAAVAGAGASMEVKLYVFPIFRFFCVATLTQTFHQDLKYLQLLILHGWPDGVCFQKSLLDMWACTILSSKIIQICPEPSRQLSSPRQRSSPVVFVCLILGPCFSMSQR